MEKETRWLFGDNEIDLYEDERVLETNFHISLEEKLVFTPRRLLFVHVYDFRLLLLCNQFLLFSLLHVDRTLVLRPTVERTCHIYNSVRIRTDVVLFVG